ncbi:uncharacterized protein SCODWIG_03125 [Saccharomycodes ludwigii]|uniref:Uncharacterized protein n=1 Tax=Saccharomycodes ludwigii TaxID=36035 RepID=A0A376B9Z8_9ASCO|nr:hypothetical protein SCDLUD_004336 [Saccharomycodes ludwigii]KAH3900019.1 hypothetical protein SCDLUD_004336 [Saccharomycodes ludwigii]SSD61364.1 uncharacterized protein SCODWIG_03125 [Saccharomycodes ludwigii]
MNKITDTHDKKSTASFLTPDLIPLSTHTTNQFNCTEIRDKHNDKTKSTEETTVVLDEQQSTLQNDIADLHNHTNTTFSPRFNKNNDAVLSVQRKTLPGWVYTLHKKQIFDKIIITLPILIKAIRIICAFSIIFFNLLLLISGTIIKKNNPFYLSRIDLSKTQIIAGLFSSLSTNVESSQINDGVGLTTSEVLIITQYTSSQVSNIPSFIKNYMYGSCSSDSCYEKGYGSAFDYREILDLSGLDIILSYAYTDITSNTAYTAYIDSVKSKNSKILTLQYFCLALQIIATGLLIWYYSSSFSSRFSFSKLTDNRRVMENKKSRFTDKYLVHVLSFLSLLEFICCCIVAIVNLYVILRMKARIKKELDSFDIHLSLGAAWLTCLWFLVASSLLSCLVWGGLEWCVAESSIEFSGLNSSNQLGNISNDNNSSDINADLEFERD